MLNIKEVFETTNMIEHDNLDVRTVTMGISLFDCAAMGISQSSDAIAIVVSEETGRIAVAIRGTFRLRLSAEKLESILAQQLIS